MSNPEEMMNKLRAPFGPDRIEWRVGSCGEKSDGSVWARCLAYIDNRAAMERLDEVYGMNWSHSEEFKQIGGQAVCTVTITIESRNEAAGGVALFPYRTVTGSCCVEANGDIDPFKSAASGAMKRAVVNLGIGRYLYDLPEAWAVIDPKGKYDGKTKQGNRFRWNPPQLPAWAGGGADVNYASNQREEIPNAPAYAVMSSAPAAPAARPAAPAAAANGNDPIIPFGDRKGQPLSSLPMKSDKGVKCGDLYYWAKVYTPKEFKGSISPKDIALKKRAEELYAAATGSPSAPSDEPTSISEIIDEVPF
jgi:hypothetical protein